MATDDEWTDDEEWADPDPNDPDDQRLFERVKRGDVAEVRRFLDGGVDVNSKRNLGFTLLITAVQYIQPGVVKLLVEKGANVHAKDDGGMTALHWAAEKGHPGVVKLLLEKGADVNTTRNNGDTVLHWLGARDFRAVIELLVEKGANVNAKNNRGYTPLHHAAPHHEKHAVALCLLEHGAFALISNYKRLTPLDMALNPWNGPPDVALICKMLLLSGALVQLATDAADAHEKRLKRIVKGLKRAVESAGFRSDLAGALAGIDATGRVRGTCTSFAALLRQLDAFARADAHGPREGGPAPKRQCVGEAYEAQRRRWHALAVERAVRSKDFLSDLAEGLAGVNMYESDPVAPKKLVAAAGRLDALSAEAAQEREAELSELRGENETLREEIGTLREQNKAQRERNETLMEENRALVAELGEVRGRAGNPGGR